MGFLFNSKKKENIVAIFDIGSGSVGGAYVKISDNKSIPHIIKSARTDIAYRPEKNLDVLLDDMLKALKITAEELYNSKVAVASSVFCVLASPWYISETRTIKMARDKAFLFNKSFVNDILKKEITNFSESYKNKYANEKSTPVLIEHQVMNVLLNGYPVDEPLGISVKSMEMNMLISMSPDIFLNKIKETLDNVFQGKEVKFSSFVLDSYLAVRGKYISPNSYLLLDIGAEITDVAIVSSGVLKSSLSFPFGKRMIYQYIASKRGIEIRDAIELFNLYNTDVISDELRRELEPLLKSVENSWSEAFRQCINALPHTITLPNTIFLTADNDVKRWFSSTILNEEYIRSMFAQYKPTVVILEGDEFLDMCGVKEGCCDPFLMLEAIAFFRKFDK